MRVITAIKRYLTPLGLLAVMALSLSGCIHLDRNVTLNSDGSGSYTLSLGINDQLLSLSDQTATTMNNFGAKVKQDGGSYKEYGLEGYTYWAYTWPFTSITRLNTLLTELPSSATSNSSAPSTSSGDTISVTEQSGFLSNTFHVTGHISLKPASGSGGSDNPQVQQYLKELRDTFTLTMPGSISAHTGGSVNGATITYAVHYGEETSIDVTGGGLDTAALTPIIAGGAGVLLVIAAVVGYVIWRSRAKRPAAAAAYGAPPSYGAPAAYGAPGGQSVSPIWASTPEAPTTPDAQATPPTPPQPE